MVLAAIQFTHIMDFMIIMPLGDQLMKEFSIDPQQFSVIVSSYTFSAGIFGFVGAFSIDRFDRKRALNFLYIGFLIGTFLCALAPSYWLLLITRSITGAFGGILGALILAIIGDAIPAERRGTAMGIVMASFSAASVFGVPFGYWLTTQFSWHAPFFLLSGMGAVIVVGIQFWVSPMNAHRNQEQARPSALQVLEGVFGRKNQQRALLFTFLMILGHFSIIPFIAPYMIRNVGFAEHEVTYIYLLGGALTIFSSPLIGRLSDRIGKYKTFLIFALLALMPIVVITHLPPVPVWVALVCTGFFFVVTGGRMIPGMTMVTSSVRPENRGSFMSINSSVQQLSSGLASFVAGLIVLEGQNGLLERYNWVGYLAVLASVLCMAVGKGIKAVDQMPPKNQDLPLAVLSPEATPVP